MVCASKLTIKKYYNDLLDASAHNIYDEEVLQEVAMIQDVYVARAMYVETGVEKLSGKKAAATKTRKARITRNWK